jgi:hypothetical protein
MDRRDFLKRTATTGGVWLALSGAETVLSGSHQDLDQRLSPSNGRMVQLPDFGPARWIWYPSKRCLQNTFVLFRRQVYLESPPRRATGWVSADSRYLLTVNGRRIQWGPPPSDPRWLEADPVELTGILNSGENVIGGQALFYGQGDGTSPIGKPGFLFWLQIEMEGGEIRTVVSDATWPSLLARAWKPGQYKRWYLRSLQEQFDARLYPYGWDSPGYEMSDDWLPAMTIKCPPNKPPICSTYADYLYQCHGSPAESELRPRCIPLLTDKLISVIKLRESSLITWRRPAEEYFECLTPDAFEAEVCHCTWEKSPGVWQIRMDRSRAVALTFELQEQVVGWPNFTIEAPAGTVVELMVHEAHQPGGPPLLNTHFNSWTRFICKQGVNRFETFDFESLRWLQLHIRDTSGYVTVRDIAVRRRLFPWPMLPNLSCSDEPIQRVIDAAVNTLNNSAQETIVDGMARERQQYSGDCGHQLHSIYFAFGETRLPARYITTFSQGITPEGYFLDCWPAYDRLARIFERQIGLSVWGPLLDHGVGFNFDCFHHFLYTGNLQDLSEAFPRLLLFASYLKGLQGKDGLLPVENLGIPTVWMDHEAYRQQRHKQCAFNLYTSAMLEHALAPLCRAFGDSEREQHARRFARQLLDATISRFWSRTHQVFVNNLPWLSEEKGIRLCDRSLATSILFDQCANARPGPALDALVECPDTMGFSYPANAGWRLWALAKMGRTDVVLKDLRQRWAVMESVQLNNTLQEDWVARPDSASQWSHCPVAPLNSIFMDIAGIKPLEAGFARYEVRPLPADLEFLEITANTVRGPIHLISRGKVGQREISISTPLSGEGELIVNGKETIPLKVVDENSGNNKRYRLPAGKKTTVLLTQT